MLAFQDSVLAFNQIMQANNVWGVIIVQIDRTNTAIVGLDLYTVAERHQSALVEAIK